MRLMASGLALVLMAGCSTGHHAVVTHDRSPSTAQVVDTYQQRWEKHAPRSYAFTLSYSSMIGGRFARVRVLDGKVVSSSAVGGKRPLLPGTDKVRTVDGVFAMLHRDVKTADKVDIGFNETWGFPENVSVDPKKNVIDEEYGYSIRQFVAP
jgi:hypothetical protein